MATRRFALILLPIYVAPPIVLYPFFFVMERAAHNNPDIMLTAWFMPMVLVANLVLMPARVLAFLPGPWRFVGMIVMGVAFWALHLGLRKLAYFIRQRTRWASVSA